MNPICQRFNSTMVRLKGCSSGVLIFQRPVFQFHNGSIKSTGCIYRALNTVKFQFHNGSIKRFTIPKSLADEFKFQFHNGSIKRQPNSLRKNDSFMCFNSTMVRLKVSVGQTSTIRKQGFNSTMVRLKVIIFESAEHSHCWFQFHNGSIKSPCSICNDLPCCCVSIPQWFD